VYPLIDPTTHFTTQSFSGKVVLITGGSVGIGATTAQFYARAGASLVLVARGAERLEQCKVDIQKLVPKAKVETVVGDISEPETGRLAVRVAVERFGRVDVVIANQFVQVRTVGSDLTTIDPSEWWYTQEVNVRGTLNIIHAAIPELLKTKGQVIVTTSQAAHIRFPLISDYCISKHTLNRFVEILALDYQELSFYAVHPGIIWTPGSTESVQAHGMADSVVMPDTLELPAATFLWLTSRNAEFLSGRYVQATWDLGEVLEKKEEIVRENLLVTKLAGPARAT
ncbi:NAD-P-binding protein, partial [Peniophora sp. CONT]